jgi:hypothetical protein
MELMRMGPAAQAALTLLSDVHFLHRRILPGFDSAPQRAEGHFPVKS